MRSTEEFSNRIDDALRAAWAGRPELFDDLLDEEEPNPLRVCAVLVDAAREARAKKGRAATKRVGASQFKVPAFSGLALFLTCVFVAGCLGPTSKHPNVVGSTEDISKR